MDYSYWAKRSLWALEEANVLLLGVAPDTARKSGVFRTLEYRQLQQLLHDAYKYGEIRRDGQDRAMGAFNNNLLYPGKEQFTPLTFINWAQREEIPVHTDLVALVEKRARKPTYSHLLEENKELQRLREKVKELEENYFEFNLNDKTYPQELDVATKAWNYVSHIYPDAKNTKQRLLAYLEENHSELNSSAKARIAGVANWNTSGGRPG